MEKATQPCHTCRRRRVKCDQTLPFCKRCEVNHHECLGYQKLFLWNRGIASRGKMMGKTFPAVLASPVIESKPGWNQARLFPPLASTATTLPATSAHVTSNGTRNVSIWNNDALAVGERPMHDALHGNLTDPHFQGLNNTNKYYLYCFGTDINRSLVLYDMPGENPFQSLVPHAEHHELLRHVIIATAALYACRMYHHTEFRSSLRDEPVSGCTMWHPLQDTYRDSLGAKQKALGLLAKAISSGNVSDDTISTCVLLFVHFELMRPGENESHVHLKGAQTLFKSLRPSKRAIQAVRNTVISDCILFDTMELTLDPKRPWSSALRHSLLPLFESIDSSNHITFPLELLNSLIVACELLRDGPATDSPDLSVMEVVSSAIGRISSIDAREWAESYSRIHSCDNCPHDIDIRIHLCEAHKAASIIFLARVGVATTTAPLKVYHARLLMNLARIMQGQYLFKATSWPTFIAGIETGDPDVRLWSIKRLETICTILPYDFVRRAVRMLKNSKLNGSAACESDPNDGWVRDLKSVSSIV